MWRCKHKHIDCVTLYHRPPEPASTLFQTTEIVTLRLPIASHLHTVRPLPDFPALHPPTIILGSTQLNTSPRDQPKTTPYSTKPPSLRHPNTDYLRHEQAPKPPYERFAAPVHTLISIHIHTSAPPIMSESYERERQNNARLDELSAKVSALRGVTVDIYDNARAQDVIHDTVRPFPSPSYLPRKRV